MRAFSRMVARELNRELEALGRNVAARVRGARVRDACILAGVLDPADAMELRAATGRQAGSVLVQGLALSRGAAWALDMEQEGGWEPHALFGVAPVSGRGDMGAPWMVGTSQLRRHPRVLVRLGRRAVELFSERWPILGNLVHSSNGRSMAWLARIGFSVGRGSVAHGPCAEPFHPFETRRQHV